MKLLDKAKCELCHPLRDGWCDDIYSIKGKMLDEKCPRVSLFVECILGGKVINKKIAS